MIAKKIILKNRFDGPPKESDFQVIEERLPEIQDGEFLVEALYLSVDPYMRAYAHFLPVGATMVGTQVAKIIESRNPNYPIGERVLGKFDWRTHTVATSQVTGVPGAGFSPPPYLIPSALSDEKDTPPLSYALGILGMPGSTAYFGLFDICRPKASDVLVVSGAAGAVGMIVGQLAKRVVKCKKVIGITGSDEKGHYLVRNMGFDGFVNYKSDDIEERLHELAPEGVDCYFDNVAGEISSSVVRCMNNFGRIAVCGSIAYYNDSTTAKISTILPYIASRNLTMEGFQNYLFEHRFEEFFRPHLQWLKEGKLTYTETVTEGFDQMPKAFIEMLEGHNLGKAIVKA